MSDEFQNYLKENGIVSQWTPPVTPQHNGVSERRNQTLLDIVQSMMTGTNLLLSFWGLALETATLLLNQVPFKIVSQHHMNYDMGNDLVLGDVMHMSSSHQLANWMKGRLNVSL